MNTQPANLSRQRAERRVPGVVIVGGDGTADLFSRFPGKLVVERSATRLDLESKLLAQSVDLIVLDCRAKLPEADLLEVARREPHADLLAVGMPPHRKTLPSWLRSHACPWPLDRDTFYRLVTTMAKHAALARTVRRQQHEMAALATEAELGRKLAQALHELNNPLDGVRRLVRFASEEADPETCRRLLADATLGLERMAGTMRELHRETRRAATRLNLVDLVAAVREAAVVSSVTKAELRIELDPATSECRVPQGLVPVMVNLLRNADAACRGTGRVVVRSRLAGRNVVVQIEDDGEGFPDLFAAELFKPWFSTKAADSGLGLGLFGSRVVVEQLGGTLEGASPGVGMGAVFTVSVPVFDDQGGGDPAAALPTGVP